jgi:hypothetical protein
MPAWPPPRSRLASPCSCGARARRATRRSGAGAGPTPIHLLSVWTLISLALAVWFIRRGNVRAHRGFMIGTFIGLAAAGLGALAPGRELYRLFVPLFLPFFA